MSSITIPAAFWRHLSEAEGMAAIRRGYFDRGEAIRLWEFLGRRDAPPESVPLMFRKEDVLRAFPPLEPKP